MKAIILAAGMGTRLGKLTRERPKALLEFQGASLLDRQVAAFRRAGLTHIVVVGGYRDELLPEEGLVRYRNARYGRTNMVESLMCARAELEGPILVSYGDILFEERVLAAVMDHAAAIGVTVDIDWKPYWQVRFGNLVEDLESLEIAAGGRILRLGRPTAKPDQLDGRYVGLLAFDAQGTETLKLVYDAARRDFADRPWQTSADFEQGYMTDLIQEIIDRGHRVDAVRVARGWLEFDTVHDYEVLTALAADGTLDQFCRLPPLESS